MVMELKTLFDKYIKLRNKLDNSKIYKIVDNTNDNLYIGSTCQSLKRRLSKHKCDYKRFLKGLCTNVTSFDIIKNNDCKIELLENCEVKTKSELLAREKHFIENNECINKVIPGRTKEEYYIANKEKIKEYRDTNEEKRNEYQKAYDDANKEKRNEYQKEYYIANKEKLNQKFDCQCGGQYNYSHKSQHIKTAKHQNFLNNL